MNAIDLLVGARLRERRFQARLSLAELASCIGVSPARLLSFEDGRERVPAQVLVRLCDALGIGLADIFAALTKPEGAPAEPERESENRPARASRFTHGADIVQKLDGDGSEGLKRIGRRLLALAEKTRGLSSEDDVSVNVLLRFRRRRPSQSPAQPG